MSQQLLKEIHSELKSNVPEDLRPGDVVDVGLRIKEGSNERVQVFRGTVIRINGGGVNKNFTVRRIAKNGIGVERTFLVHSPRVEYVKIERHSVVRRARLYYLRDLVGKKARLKQKF